MMKKLFFILVLATATAFAAGMMNGPKPEPVYVTATAIEYNTSTAWDIACKLAQKYGDERDVRAIIYDAKKLNPGVDLYTIQPQQKIKFRLEPEK